MAYTKSLWWYFWKWYNENRYTVEEWGQEIILYPKDVEERWYRLRNNYNGQMLALFAELFGPAGDVWVQYRSKGYWNGALGPGVLVMVPKYTTPVETLSQISIDSGLPGFETVEYYPPSGSKQSGQGYAWFTVPANTTVVADLVKYAEETGETIEVTSQMVENAWETYKTKYEPLMWGFIAKWVYNTYNLISLIWSEFYIWHVRHSCDTPLTDEEKARIEEVIV